jgi:hypothetical protein
MACPGGDAQPQGTSASDGPSPADPGARFDRRAGRSVIGGHCLYGVALVDLIRRKSDGLEGLQGLQGSLAAGSRRGAAADHHRYFHYDGLAPVRGRDPALRDSLFLCLIW